MFSTLGYYLGLTSPCPSSTGRASDKSTPQFFVSVHPISADVAWSSLASRLLFIAEHLALVEVLWSLDTDVLQDFSMVSIPGDFLTTSREDEIVQSTRSELITRCAISTYSASGVVILEKSSLLVRFPLVRRTIS